MANEKYKLYGVDADGNEKLLTTESHPKLTASASEKGQAAMAVAACYQTTATRIDLSSDTTVWTAA